MPYLGALLSRSLPSSEPSREVLQVNFEPPNAKQITDVRLQSNDSEIDQLQRKDKEFTPIFMYLEDNIMPNEAKQLAPSEI